jgi:hypothetical protein
MEFTSPHLLYKMAERIVSCEFSDLEGRLLPPPSSSSFK